VITYIVNLVLGSFLGATVALYFENLKKPRLRIEAGEDANSDNKYANNPPPLNGRWKFFRVKVYNKPFPKFISWLISTETAEQVRAVITFKDLGVSMKGRWASTLELAQTSSPNDWIRLSNFPEPISLIAGEKPEYLDIFTMSEFDTVAYGWNNESYINQWRNHRYLLKPGNHKIEIMVANINGEKTIKIFSAHIGKNINKTKLKGL
jgi:hypothetical protein